MIDRIKFYNPGKLYGGITIDDLLSGNYTSKSRNKLVAKIFKEARLIERYGSGIMRVRQICKDYGVIEPQFCEISNVFFFLFTYTKQKVSTNLLTTHAHHLRFSLGESNQLKLCFTFHKLFFSKNTIFATRITNDGVFQKGTLD